MTPALIVTFLVMFSLSSLVIILTIYNRHIIPAMTGMMIAMAHGMIVGLTAGVILGASLSDSMYYSTVISILIGVIAGFLIGVPSGLLAVLDGTLSGLMGGMMGAMLGQMIAPEYYDPLIRMMLMVFISVTFLLFLLIKQEFVNKTKNQPYLIVGLFLFVLFVVIYNQIGPIIPPSPDTPPILHDSH